MQAGGRGKAPLPPPRHSPPHLFPSRNFCQLDAAEVARSLLMRWRCASFRALTFFFFLSLSSALSDRCTLRWSGMCRLAYWPAGPSSSSSSSSGAFSPALPAALEPPAAAPAPAPGAVEVGWEMELWGRFTPPVGSTMRKAGLMEEPPPAEAPPAAEADPEAAAAVEGAEAYT